MRVCLRIKASMALFTNTGVSQLERFSYPFITPSAGRGVFFSVFGKPEVDWVVSRIHVIELGRAMKYAVNETNHPKLKPKSRPFSTSAGRCQVSQRVLTNVDYILEARPEVLVPVNPEDGSENSHIKYKLMMERRLARGQYYKKPFAGMRDFPCDVSLWDEEIPETSAPDMDVGQMLLGISYGKSRGDGGGNIPVFFDAKLRDGVCNVPFFVGSRLKPGSVQ